MKRSVLALALAAVLGTSLSACFPLIAGGVAGSAMVVSDRRTSGVYLDDQSVAVKAANQITQALPESHVNITSFNRTVLMTGELLTDSDRLKAETLVRALPGVNRVRNYTVIATPTTLGQRNNDTWITTKVRSRLLAGNGYPSSAIKLVTERGVVYMMGLVTQSEGDAAAAVVSQTSGVQKVVTLIEYITILPGVAPAPLDASQPAAQTSR
jgi:osmotically-inducible protein OsmY